ncbi:MAG: glycine--tRNA ligase [Candidatus Nanohaloarchaea archaeon]
MSESEELDEIARRRGFYSQTAESYGGVAGFYTFGPEGAELKRNIENSWRDWFRIREGHREIEAPTIMPEPIFESSGHLDGFDDMIIECPECGTSSRADHLVEDNTDIEEAESFSTDQIEALIEDHDLCCPTCGHDLTGIEVDDFNLMFSTNIGPGDSSPGYLRPETAQGIFAEFPRFKEYAREQLPFAITQLGKAYRNEISPRNALVRVREFTQAELEHFIDPERDEPELEKVEDIELKLYPAEKQGEGEYVRATVREAVENGIIESEWIAYYLGLAKQWYMSIGVDMDRFRFRQHLEGERAHYATDCWDAESEVDGDWIEIAGFAYRGCYDLKKHHENSEDDFRIFRQYDEPKTVEDKTVNPDMGYLGPEYGEKAGDIAESLEKLAEDEPEAFDSDHVTVTVGDEEFEIPSGKANFSVEEKEKNGEKFLPHVVEPSFGIGRTVYTVLAHRMEEEEIEDGERTVMRFSPEIAPTEVAVLPLMDKEGMGEKAEELVRRLRAESFSVSADTSGSIGRRYRRQDEVGTPVCVTVDYETLEEGTVTLRDRDSTEQARVDVEDLERSIIRFLSGTELEDL